MNRFRVHILAEVERAIDAQVFHIARDSVDRALEWQARLLDAIDQIGELRGGHAVDEAASERLGQEVRKMTFERTYLVHYFVERGEDLVTVIHFRHGAMLPNDGEP